VVSSARAFLVLAAGLCLASSGCSSLLGITDVIQAPDGGAGRAGSAEGSAGATGSIAGEAGGGIAGSGGSSDQAGAPGIETAAGSDGGAGGAGGTSDSGSGPGGILFRGGIGTLAPSSGEATASIRLVRPYVTIAGASVCGAGLCMNIGGILP
jgi:hypothetical protein